MKFHKNQFRQGHSHLFICFLFLSLIFMQCVCVCVCFDVRLRHTDKEIPLYKHFCNIGTCADAIGVYVLSAESVEKHDFWSKTSISTFTRPNTYVRIQLQCCIRRLHAYICAALCLHSGPDRHIATSHLNTEPPSNVLCFAHLKSMSEEAVTTIRAFMCLHCASTSNYHRYIRKHVEREMWQTHPTSTMCVCVSERASRHQRNGTLDNVAGKRTDGAARAIGCDYTIFYCLFSIFYYISK